LQRLKLLDDIKNENENVETPSKKSKKVRRSKRNNTSDGTFELHSAFSHTMARKLLQRLKLLDDIKNEVVRHPKLQKRLAKQTTLKSEMPNWWTSTQDEGLLHVVAEFGFGTQEWEEAIKNKDSLFYYNKLGQPDYKSIKQKFLEHLIKDKTMLIKRVEFLRSTVLEGKSSDKSVSEYPTSALLTRNIRKLKGDELVELTDSGSTQSSQVKLNLNIKASTKEVERDSNGNPKLPFTAKGATIHSLGTVIFDRAPFSSKSYIWPVGFKSSRKLPSLSTANTYVNYYSEILDGGTGPIFQVTPGDDPTHSITHHTSSGVWCEMLKLIKKNNPSL